MATKTCGHLRTDSEATLHGAEASTSSLWSMGSGSPLRARDFYHEQHSSPRSVGLAFTLDGLESGGVGMEGNKGGKGRVMEGEGGTQAEGLMLVQQVLLRLSTGSEGDRSSQPRAGSSDHNSTVTTHSPRNARLPSDHYEQGSGLDAYEWSNTSTPSVSSSSTTPALSSSHSNASFDWTTTGSCGVMTPPPGRELASLGLPGNFLSSSSHTFFDSIDVIGSNEGKELIVDEELDWELEGIRRGRGRKSGGFAF